jgi:hypothetical protein
MTHVAPAWGTLAITDHHCALLSLGGRARTGKRPLSPEHQREGVMLPKPPRLHRKRWPGCWQPVKAESREGGGGSRQS